MRGVGARRAVLSVVLWCVAATAAAVCGNGIPEPATEECDSGGVDTAVCDGGDCTLPLCRDGYLNLAAGEFCDDANLNVGDGCRPNCTLELCGDGILDPGEACDDGNGAAGDGCSSICDDEGIPACGDGIWQVGEECDDGNPASGDGCSSICEVEFADCGSVIVAGHDADDHGFYALYARLFEELLLDVTNGQSGILAIGVNQPAVPPPPPNIVPYQWINRVVAEMVVPMTISYAVDNALSTVDFSQYAILYVPSSDFQVLSGGLSQFESDILGSRAADIAAFVNGGGTLFGLTQYGLFGSWGYLSQVAPLTTTPVFDPNGRFDDISATPDGRAIGITDIGLDGCCFHDIFTAWPAYLRVLATANEPVQHPTIDGRPVFLGGSQVCLTPFCGDGNPDPGEQCDDGNNIPGDGCSAVCVVELACGNGTIDPGEECDDGNQIPGDGCDDVCVLEAFCGNGTIDAGEECDDGNQIPGDGCSGCFIERCNVLGVSPIELVRAVKSVDRIHVVLSYLLDSDADGFNTWYVDVKTDIPAARDGGAGARPPTCAPSASATCWHFDAVPPVPEGPLLFYQVRGACSGVEAAE